MKYNIEFIRLLAVVLITFTHTRHHIEEGFTYYLIEVVPTYGTLFLSLISGYLFFKNSRTNPQLFANKFKSLAIPYLIANLMVLLPVLVLKMCGIDVLNRLTFDYTLITEGIFSLNSPPINPPTYFIRDLFMIFLFIDLLMNRNYKLLLIIIPYATFGQIMLRYDILALFTIGALYARYKEYFLKKMLVPIALTGLSVLSFFYFPDYQRYVITTLLFIFLIDIEMMFINVGGFTYLLHLYHSPIIVITFPLLNKFIENEIWSVICQISLAVLGAFILFRFTRQFKQLKIASGGR